MRVLRIISTLLAAATPAAAQSGTQAASGLPSGWSARTDRDADVSTVKFAPMGSGMHLTSGRVAGVYYRGEDQVSGGKFHSVATFTQTKAPMHPEGYGLFLAGSDLAGPNQKYVYFLVRGDGMFLVKKRDGANTSDVAPWTANDAVQKADSAGKATNKVEIDAAGAKVAFKVNGKTVYEMDAAPADRAGVVGLRVNHGLDLHIDGFAVHKM